MISLRSWKSGGLYLSCLRTFLDTLRLEHLELFFIFSILPQKIYSRRQRQIGVWTFVSGWPGVYPVISVPDFTRKGEHIFCLKTNLKGIRKISIFLFSSLKLRWEYLKRQDIFYFLEVPRGSHWISRPVDRAVPLELSILRNAGFWNSLLSGPTPSIFPRFLDSPFSYALGWRSIILRSSPARGELACRNPSYLENKICYSIQKK